MPQVTLIVEMTDAAIANAHSSTSEPEYEASAEGASWHLELPAKSWNLCQSCALVQRSSFATFRRVVVGPVHNGIRWVAPGSVQAQKPEKKI